MSLKVECYRTLENVTLNFPQYYTAICGKNNSGKSNVIRAIRFLFGEADRFPYREEVGVIHKSDLSIWKKDDPDNPPISMFATVELDRTTDKGLVEFIERIAKVEALPDSNKVGSLRLDISVTIGSEKKTGTKVIFEATELDNVASDEILKKLRAASTIIYHNSTQTHSYYYSRRRRVHAVLTRVDEASKERLKNQSEKLKKEMDKVLESHRTELAGLLGRLEERFEIKLSAPAFDLEEFPFEISLGYRGYDVPLEDWGSGTQNQTLILNSLFDAKKVAELTSVSDRITPIVLIEEPESFLHPLAQAHFGNVLQDLTDGFHIQVIATTHSPYLLSHKYPEANILLSRTQNARTTTPGPSVVVSVDDSDWKKPFEHALGIVGPEFEVFKSALFSQSNVIILVEGEIDKEYLEMCRAPQHGANSFTTVGDIFCYGGWSMLNNTVFMKFIRDRFSKVVVTVDLDAEKDVMKSMQTLNFQKNVDLYLVGLNEPGNRCVEGLVPEHIKLKVQTHNPKLVNALQSNVSEEVKSAKSRLKKLYLEEFRTSASVTNGDYNQFYKLVKSINKFIGK